MYHTALHQGYEGVHLSCNNFPVKLNPQIWGLLHTLVELQGIETAARDLISKEISRQCDLLTTNKQVTNDF